MTLPGADFLHRFLQHVLPPGFQRLRHYGLTASRCKKAKLTLCRQPLRVTAPEPRPQETVEVFWLRVAVVDIHRCPECDGNRRAERRVQMQEPTSWTTATFIC